MDEKAVYVEIRRRTTCMVASQPKNPCSRRDELHTGWVAKHIRLTDVQIEDGSQMVRIEDGGHKEILAGAVDGCSSACRVECLIATNPTTTSAESEQICAASA